MLTLHTFITKFEFMTITTNKSLKLFVVVNPVHGHISFVLDPDRDPFLYTNFKLSTTLKKYFYFIDQQPLTSDSSAINLVNMT